MHSNSLNKYKTHTLMQWTFQKSFVLHKSNACCFFICSSVFFCYCWWKSVKSFHTPLMNCNSGLKRIVDIHLHEANMFSFTKLLLNHFQFIMKLWRINCWILQCYAKYFITSLFHLPNFTELKFHFLYEPFPISTIKIMLLFGMNWR